MILRSQIPLGELRLDNGGPTVMLTVYKPSVHDALSIDPPTISIQKNSITIALPYYVKMLYEGQVMAHMALWSPYYEGDYFPRADLLNDRLVRNLQNMEGTPYQQHLNNKHAEDIAFRRRMELERKDWEWLDSLKYGDPKPPMKRELPSIGQPFEIYNNLIKQYYP